MREGQCGTDHMVQRVTTVAVIQPPVRKTSVKTTKVNMAVLQTERGVKQLDSRFSSMVLDQKTIAEQETDTSSAITREWADFLKKLDLASTETL